MGTAQSSTVTTHVSAQPAGGALQTVRAPDFHSGIVPAIDIVEDISVVEADWKRLERDPLNSLHQSLDWCRTWSAASGNPVLNIRGQIDGYVVFLLPLEIVLTNSVRIARFPGSNFSNINTGLIDEGFAAAADDATADHIATTIRRLLSGRADVVALQNVPLNWRGRRSPFAALSSVANQNHSFQLPLLESFQATIAQLNAKRRRKKFRVQARRAADIGGYRHVLAATADDRHALLETFFRQKAERFATHKIPDVFHPTEIKTFFHTLLDVEDDGLDTPLELHAICLEGENEGEIVAVSGLSRKGDHVICQFGSISDRLAQEASPGELLFWHMIERACQQKAAIFDFGIGDQIYKRSWCPVETIQHDIFIPVSLKGKLAAWVLMATAKAKAVIKANPRLYAWFQEMRSKTGARSRPAASTSED
jgi:CelD/BcsL family acetyltransferase involved in cellulose biosynthesis